MPDDSPQAGPLPAVGPADARVLPRFAGPDTFARLPRRDQVERCDVAIVGVPFDSGVSYRPGARFGPAGIRQGSKLLRPYHPQLDVEPFGAQQVADAGDIGCNPFSIDEAIAQIERGAEEVLAGASHLITLGGDHTIALPLLRVARRPHGQVAVLHFDAHLDTWDTYFGARTRMARHSAAHPRKGCWTRPGQFTWAPAGRCTPIRPARRRRARVRSPARHGIRVNRRGRCG